MNFESVKLEDGKVIDEKGNDLGNLLEFLESFSELVTSMKMELTNYTSVHTTPALKKELKESLEKEATEYFTKFFKEKGEATAIEVDNAANQLINTYTDYGDELHEEILKLIESKLSKKNKVNGGDDMFKSLKEARNFTAHLDALANEIEGLDGVGSEMRKHLAFRLDRLSDLIENSMSKQANGVGSGAWAYDADEARYMSTMGGTGALEKDKDEPYMDTFKGADHKEVLERKENTDINGAGKKVKQPSDDYKEGPVANNLRSTILKVLNKK
jgi:hypothetical protein